MSKIVTAVALSTVTLAAGDGNRQPAHATTTCRQPSGARVVTPHGNQNIVPSDTLYLTGIVPPEYSNGLAFYFADANDFRLDYFKTTDAQSNCVVPHEPNHLAVSTLSAWFDGCRTVNTDYGPYTYCPPPGDQQVIHVTAQYVSWETQRVVNQALPDLYLDRASASGGGGGGGDGDGCTSTRYYNCA
jgi:hypothetical protein